MSNSKRGAKRHSVWPSRKPGKKLLADAVDGLEPELKVELSTVRDLDRAIEAPSLTVWDAVLTLRYGIDLGKRRPAVIATASCWVVDRSAEEDWEIALLDRSGEMESLATVADDYSGPFARDVSDEDVGATLMFAEDLVVDRAWRGAGIGPALLQHIAGLLRCNGILLAPYALGTKVSEHGVPYTDYEARREPGGQQKVMDAYARAGFERYLAADYELAEDEDDEPHDEEDTDPAMFVTVDRYLVAVARDTLAKAQKVAALPAPRGWYLRRMRRYPRK